VTVTVRYFAYLRDAAGSETATVELAAGATLADLAVELERRHPALAGRLGGLPCLVDGVRREPPWELQDGQEVAWIPPVAGGVPETSRGRLRQERLQLDELVEFVVHPGAGAVASFLGVVRDHEGERAVARLEYEAYERAAEPVLASIAKECTERWPGCRAAVDHRVGALELGEASVAIAVSSPHRAEAFAACRYVIEEIKRRLPVWKKSHGPGGAWWVEGQPFEGGPPS
jgi:molybdopterin synthase catalytic subunit/molybdopterin converting factor small subunit